MLRRMDLEEKRSERIQQLELHLFCHPEQELIPPNSNRTYEAHPCNEAPLEFVVQVCLLENYSGPLVGPERKILRLAIVLAPNPTDPSPLEYHTTPKGQIVLRHERPFVHGMDCLYNPRWVLPA